MVSHFCEVTDKVCEVSGITRGGAWGVQTPPGIPKNLQNRAKLNLFVKTVKYC